MAKPPPDINREHFIVGRGVYSSRRIAVPFADDHEFRIDPSPLPIVAIIVLNMLFIAFCYGFHWVAKTFASDEAGFFIVYIVPIGMGTLVSLLYTTVTCWSVHREKTRGPWVVYNKTSRHVRLPRENVEFAPNEIVYVQYVTTKNPDWGGVANNSVHSEVNLVTCKNGNRQRWHLINSNATINAFDYLLRPMSQETDLPIVRITDQWLGWEVTVAPY